jgi:hypothetical protein
MRLAMSNEDGEDLVTGTFEELSAEGRSFPLRITVSRLAIRLEGLSVFAKYLAEGESR